MITIAEVLGDQPGGFESGRTSQAREVIPHVDDGVLHSLIERGLAAQQVHPAGAIGEQSRDLVSDRLVQLVGRRDQQRRLQRCGQRRPRQRIGEHIGTCHLPWLLTVPLATR